MRNLKVLFSTQCQNNISKLNALYWVYTVMLLLIQIHTVVDAAAVVTFAEADTNASANDADEFVMTWLHLLSGMSYITPGSG